MSAVSAAATTTSRPSTVTAAAVLLAALAALGVVAALIGAEEHGAAFVVICLVISAIRGLAAFGVWRARRWAVILGVVITLIDALMAFPSIFDGSSTSMQVMSAIAIPIDLATLVLLVWPSSRRAYA